jgi:PucR C-terminal helix-turn-helix domain/GGDEF-like domain
MPFGVKEQQGSSESLRAIRAGLAARLRARAPEIEKTIANRIRRLVQATGANLSCGDSLEAVAATVAYSIEGLERGSDWPLSIPPTAVQEARRGARAGFGLDLVLRGYLAGERTLAEFVMVEAEAVPRRALSQILAEHRDRIDHLIETAAAEYEDELRRLKRSTAQREADRIVELLQSDCPLIPADIEYDFEAWHVGMIVKGGNAELVARALAERSGHRALHVARDPETTWAWVSCARQASLTHLERFLTENVPPEISLAIGEPRKGLGGWRQTHREAELALQVMLRRPQGLTRGRDVILLVATMRDDALVEALVGSYLVPLTAPGYPGRTLLATLRAYFSAGGNAAAAAASLGVTRHTVQRRIRTIEQTLGRPLHVCQPELQVALRIEELEGDALSKKFSFS